MIESLRLESFGSHQSLKAWQWQRALHLLELMATKVPPNEVCFTAAISACEKAE